MLTYTVSTLFGQLIKFTSALRHCKVISWCYSGKGNEGVTGTGREGDRDMSLRHISTHRHAHTRTGTHTHTHAHTQPHAHARTHVHTTYCACCDWKYPSRARTKTSSRQKTIYPGKRGCGEERGDTVSLPSQASSKWPLLCQRKSFPFHGQPFDRTQIPLLAPSFAPSIKVSCFHSSPVLPNFLGLHFAAPY